MAQKIDKSIFDKIFNLKNFQIAFEKVKNNLVGSIFEGDIEFITFDQNLDLNLLILIEKALNSNYQRYPYYKYENKKSSDETRIIYELHYTDQIIMQSILNIIGPDLDGAIYEKSYGNRLDIKSNQYVFKDWRKQYTKCHTDLYNEVRKYINDSQYYLINTDIKDFYNCILTDKLLIILEDFKVKNPKVKELIEKFFYKSDDGLLILPQGPAFSHLLANLYLSKLDNFLIKKSINYFRYVDDIWIIFKVEKSPDSIGFEEIMDFLSELTTFLKKYNLNIHDYTTDNEGKTKIYNIKKVHEELIEKLIVNTYGAFIDFDDSEEVDQEALEFSDFLLLLEEESDKMNIDEFLHKNSFRILTFIKKRYEKQKQELIIYELLQLPKIRLRKAIILFSILLEIRNFDITQETYDYIIESPSYTLIPFLLAIKEKAIESIVDSNNLVFKLLKNLVEQSNSNVRRELAFKKYMRILMNKHFLTSFDKNILEIIKLTKNSIRLKKIVLLFTNKVENLLEDKDVENFFQMCSNLNLKKVDIWDIIFIEDFLHTLSLYRDCLNIYQKSKEFLSFSFKLYYSDLISSNPQIFTFLITIFLRIPEDNLIKIISKLYQNNSKLFDFKIDIIIKSKIVLSEIYQNKNYEFFKSEKKRFVKYIKDSDNAELQDIVFLNMKEYFFIESPEEKDSIKNIIPFVYHFRDIHYYNKKIDEKVFTEEISHNTLFSYDILLLKSCYNKLFRNVLKIEAKADKYILKYTVHEDYQSLRDLVGVENSDVSDKQFIKILLNLVEKLTLLDDQDIFAFLNFDNIYFNPNNFDVILIFVGPNLFRKLYYFSLEIEKNYQLDYHREKKIYRILRNIIFEYFSGFSIISNPSLLYEDFYEIVNKNIYNPYLNYIFKRSSYETDDILFDNFSDYALIIKRLATLWDFYKENQEFCDVLEIFDFDMFLIERYFHIIKDEKSSDFNKIHRIFNYYHNNLLNITILRNFFIKPDINWLRMLKLKSKKYPVFNEIYNYINQSKILELEIKGENLLEINSLRLRKFCFISLFYSYIELIFRALYYICLRYNLIEKLKTNDEYIRIDLDYEGLHHQNIVKNLQIDINQTRSVIEKLDINRSEIANILKEVSLNDFLLLMVKLILMKKLKKNYIFTQVRLNLESLLSHSNYLVRIFNYPIIKRVLSRYKDIMSLPPNKKKIIFLNIINFLKSSDNFLNYSFSNQINQMLNSNDITLTLNNSIRILTEIFSPLFDKIKKSEVRFKKVRKIKKTYTSKKNFFRKEHFYDSDLALISLLPRQLIKDEKHYKYALKEKINRIPLIYNYPISQVCFNNKRNQSKMLLWREFILDFNMKLKQYKFGNTLALNSLMNEFNFLDINHTKFIIKQCIKEKKIIKKIGFLFDNELIIKEKRRHKIWRGIKKLIFQLIIISIIGTIIGGIILQYILGLL